jgi:hypothetical protein
MKYLSYNKSMPYEARVDTLIQWMQNDSLRLTTLYFEEPDLTGHSYGPDSPQVRLFSKKKMLFIHHVFLLCLSERASIREFSCQKLQLNFKNELQLLEVTYNSVKFIIIRKLQVNNFFTISAIIGVFRLNIKLLGSLFH